MNATLADHNIQIDRTQLIPTQQDEFSKQWAVQLAQQQVRAAGIWGSRVMSLPIGEYEWSVTTPQIFLPTWFNGSRPPMIWGMPQYGSVIIYKQFQDSNETLTQHDPSWQSSGKPLFRTYVTNLKYAGSTWSFNVKHDVSIPYNRLWVRDFGLSKAWFPDMPLLTTYQKMVLHYYCLGVETGD